LNYTRSFITFAIQLHYYIINFKTRQAKAEA